MFEQMYQRLEAELGVKRKDMARLLDEVGKVYSDRDAVIAKLNEAQKARDAQIKKMEESEANTKVESGEDDEALEIGDRKLNDIERLQAAFKSRGMGEQLTPEEMAEKFI
jgi:seryl-tRNA synthetase